MSQSTSRLFYAFEAVKAAIAELREAALALPNEEYTQDLPTVLVCSYEPLQKQAQFTLLGTVHHAAQTFEQAMTKPENDPFRHAFMEAMQHRLATQGD